MLNWENKKLDDISELNFEFKLDECINPIFIYDVGQNGENKNLSILKPDHFSLKNVSRFENGHKYFDQFDTIRPIYSNFSDLGYNLLIEGDNKSGLNYLIKNGFKGKIDLIYLDPPFMKNTNFFKKIELEGIEEDKKILIKLKQYKDKWVLGEYLQFIYERIFLLKSLLKETGSIYMHLDESISHYVKVIMDEVFGKENFHRDIIWNTASLNVAGFKGQVKNNWIYGSEHILFYSKSDNYTFNVQYRPRSKKFIKDKYKKSDDDGLYRITRRYNKIYLKDDKGEPMINIWNDILSFNYAKIAGSESVFYPTQKPEALLERIINASSNPEDIVLDCFVGSGTTVTVAEKLNRRWIGCDVNDNAIHTTSKRIQRLNFDKMMNSKNEKFEFKSNAKILKYKIFNQKDRNTRRRGEDFFEYDISFEDNFLTVNITVINHEGILELIYNSNEISKSSLKALDNINIFQFDSKEFVLLDSVFIDIRKNKDPIFKVLFSDLPSEKNEKISGRYIFDLKKCLLADEIFLKVKIVDKFGNNYEMSKIIKA